MISLIKKLKKITDKIFLLKGCIRELQKLENRKYLKHNGITKLQQTERLLARVKSEIDDAYEQLFSMISELLISGDVEIISPESTKKMPEPDNPFDMDMNKIFSKEFRKDFFKPWSIDKKLKELDDKFDFQRDWLDKNNVGYGKEIIYQYPKEIISLLFPKFNPNNSETYPPNARWVLFADKYDREYIESLESPTCFKAALQCFGLSITSREFEYELQKMEMISSNAANLFLQYCEDLEIASVNDFEIEVLRKIISSEEE